MIGKSHVTIYLFLSQTSCMKIKLRNAYFHIRVLFYETIMVKLNYITSMLIYLTNAISTKQALS